MQRVVIESKDIVSKNKIGFHFSKEVGIAYKPRSWFSLFLAYNTQTVDAEVIKTIFSGRFGTNMIAGLNFGFNLVY